MNEEIRLSGRFALARKTDEEWKRLNPILNKGEKILVDIKNNVQEKVGDGVTEYTKLPWHYQTSQTVQNISSIATIYDSEEKLPKTAELNTKYIAYKNDTLTLYQCVFVEPITWEPVHTIQENVLYIIGQDDFFENTLYKFDKESQSFMPLMEHTSLTISDLDEKIYQDITTLPKKAEQPTLVNGDNKLAWTNGKPPLCRCTYIAATDSWKKTNALNNQTLYINIRASKKYNAPAYSLWRCRPNYGDFVRVAYPQQELQQKVTKLNINDDKNNHTRVYYIEEGTIQETIETSVALGSGLSIMVRAIPGGTSNYNASNWSYINADGTPMKSPYEVDLSVELAIPNVTISNNVASWSAIEGAVKYEYIIGNVIGYSNNRSFADTYNRAYIEMSQGRGVYSRYCLTSAPQAPLDPDPEDFIKEIKLDTIPLRMQDGFVRVPSSKYGEVQPTIPTDSQGNPKYSEEERAVSKQYVDSAIETRVPLLNNTENINKIYTATFATNTKDKLTFYLLANGPQVQTKSQQGTTNYSQSVPLRSADGVIRCNTPKDAAGYACANKEYVDSQSPLTVTRIMESEHNVEDIIAGSSGTLEVQYFSRTPRIGDEFHGVGHTSNDGVVYSYAAKITGIETDGDDISYATFEIIEAVSMKPYIDEKIEKIDEKIGNIDNAIAELTAYAQELMGEE